MIAVPPRSPIPTAAIAIVLELDFPEGPFATGEESGVPALGPGDGEFDVEGDGDTDPDPVGVGEVDPPEGGGLC